MLVLHGNQCKDDLKHGCDIYLRLRVLLGVGLGAA